MPISTSTVQEPPSPAPLPSDRSTRPRPWTARWASALLVASLVVAGCSSDDEPPDPEDTTTSAAGSSPSSADDAPTTAPTTAPETAPVEPSPEATAATLTAGDMGGEWVEFVPEDAPEDDLQDERDDPTCENSTGLVEPLDPSATSNGPILQMGDRVRFVRTDAWVFPDEAAAEAFAAHLLSDDLIECRRARLEDELTTDDATFRIVVQSVDRTPAGAHRGTVTLGYEVQDDTGAFQTAPNISQHDIYVEGTTVVDLYGEQGRLDDDPADLDGRYAAAVDAGLQVVLARIAAGA